MRSKFIKFSVLYLLAVSFLFTSCAAVRPKKVSKKGSLAQIASGPKKGFTTRQELTSVTEVVWKLDAKDEAPIERARKTGLKIIALYEVVERTADSVRIQVAIEKTEVLKAGKFIPAPFMQFNPPNPVFFTVYFGDGRSDFSSLENAFDEWVKGLKETAVWDVMGKTFDVKSYVSQLEDLLSSPVTDFAGRTMKLGDETVEEKTFHLPFLGPAISVGPVEVEQKVGLRGVMDLAGRDIAIIEGEQFSDKLSADTQVLADKMDLFGRPVPEYFESKGEIGGKFKARVDTASGWTVETTKKFRSVTLFKFENGTLREDISGKKTVFEM